MQALSVAVNHAFVRLGFTSATENQKEVLSEYVRGRDFYSQLAL